MQGLIAPSRWLQALEVREFRRRRSVLSKSCDTETRSLFDTAMMNIVRCLEPAPGSATTDDRIHGNREYAFFNGCYDHYCHLPPYVFCGDRLLCAYLRPSKIDAAKHSRGILKLLARRIRESWPKVRIVFRADSVAPPGCLQTSGTENTMSPRKIAMSSTSFSM